MDFHDTLNELHSSFDMKQTHNPKHAHQEMII